MTEPTFPDIASCVVNPEAIGEPDQTPVMTVSADLMRLLNPCHCGGINRYHQAGCVSRDDGCGVRPPESSPEPGFDDPDQP